MNEIETFIIGKIETKASFNNDSHWFFFFPKIFTSLFCYLLYIKVILTQNLKIKKKK